MPALVQSTGAGFADTKWIASELVYQTLRRCGIDTQLVVYPDRHHSGWAPSMSAINAACEEWFDKYLK